MSSVMSNVQGASTGQPTPSFTILCYSHLLNRNLLLPEALFNESYNLFTTIFFWLAVYSVNPFKTGVLRFLKSFINFPMNLFESKIMFNVQPVPNIFLWPYYWFNKWSQKYNLQWLPAIRFFIFIGFLVCPLDPSWKSSNSKVILFHKSFCFSSLSAGIDRFLHSTSLLAFPKHFGLQCKNYFQIWAKKNKKKVTFSIFGVWARYLGVAKKKIIFWNGKKSIFSFKKYFFSSTQPNHLGKSWFFICYSLHYS